MWRFALLAFSILFFSAQPAEAHKHRHKHHHRGVVVVKHRWHHQHWRHVHLEPRFVTYLRPVAFAGPGYHLVTVYFEDGSRAERVYVYDRGEIEVPPAYEGRKMIRIVVTN